MFGKGGQNKLLDDVAGLAGGAFALLAGLRAELEQMVQAQIEAWVKRLELVQREEFEAALEVARRARAEVEGLLERVAALEARLARRETGKDAGSSSGED